MKRYLLKAAYVCVINLLLTSCVVSKIKPINEVSSTNNPAILSPTVFLLERDIPQDIERLGIVTIALNSRATLNVDSYVKEQLAKDCQTLGANGAYRVNDGTYFPNIVSYLVFRYRK